ncbi:MAG: isoleucine--tRNA ligase [Candidatus Sulfotelmatobacter sp.]
MPFDLKATINLPKTAFPMKANLPHNEPKMLARWEEMRIYDRIREARKGSAKGTYILHDGPPYTSGPIHLGTALNKCLKDFIVKSKTMAGFDAPYVPGWDCHGLPIEIKVDKELGGRKLQMRPIDVRAACRKYTQKFLDLQRQQFKRIGVFGRFDRPYATMNPQYESVVLSTFFSFYENGFVYKGLRAVYWCMHDETALAEAEVEYENHTSPTVWVKFELLDDPAKIDAALAAKKVSTIIWTTTPWTLPASMAVAFHPDEEYAALESAGEVYIVASKLAKDVAEKCNLSDPRELAHFPGRKLEHLNFQHPFLDRKILGVLAEYVTMDTGTGVVHTAPSHGAEDFITGIKYGLDATSNVDEKGILRNGLPQYAGKRVWEANQPIIDLVKSRGALLHAEKTEHSYPHCWRCHNPVIFRATEQWFISMETPMPASVGGRSSENDTLRTRTLEEIKHVKWDPAWGEERLSNMIATRPDWCISRQRVWGVPIAVFLCENCRKPLNDHAVNRKVVELFARSGADAWFTSESDSILPAGTKCPHCGSTKFEKETDIFDVWLESGASYLALIADEPSYPWPSDLYLEGGDQYRGWFQSSLLCAMGTHGTPPYKGVVTPGWTLDEKGQAMSKSRGNDVDPVDIADRMGAEVVRLWVASVDFREDVVGSEQLMQRVAENYRKIRNTFRYILGNIGDFDPERDAVPTERMEALDQYMLRRTAGLAVALKDWYDEFAFHKIYHRVNDFCIVDLSAFYLDVLKDRLYISAPKSQARRSAQTAIWRIGEALVRLLAPIMSFTCEEVWPYLPKAAQREESVHLASFPSPREVASEADTKSDDDWATLRAVRDEVLKALEEARNNKLIGTGLEAQVTLTAPDPVYSVLARHAGELRYLFIVSAVTLVSGPGNGTGQVHVEVKKADGAKCERCWNYSIHVGEDKVYPTVCERCSAVLKEIAGT